MKIHKTILSSLLLLALTSATPVYGQALPEGVTKAAHPATLLSTLPAPPPGWKTTTSHGDTELRAWMISQAERIIEKVEFAQGEDPSRPGLDRDMGNT